MHFLFRFLVPLVLSGCIAAMLGSCVTAPITSGISGYTTIDAGCAETIDSLPCGEVPLPARISITGAASTTVLETISNDQGKFRVELPPGTYELHAENLTGAPLPSAVSEHVVVEAGTFTEVRMEFDSGVR